MILELVLEGTYEASRSKLVPKPLRIVLAVALALLLAAAVGLTVLAGVLNLRDGHPIGGSVLLALAALLLAAVAYMFWRTYAKRGK